MSRFSMDWPELSLQVMITFSHFLWQACAVGFVLFVVQYVAESLRDSRSLLRLRRGNVSLGETELRGANIRYTIACVAFFSLPICVIATFAWVHQSRGPIVLVASDPVESPSSPMASAYEATPTMANTDSPVLPPTATLTSAEVSATKPIEPPTLVLEPQASPVQRIEAFAPYLLLAYMVGVGFMLARFLLSIIGSSRLRQTIQPITDVKLLKTIAEQCARVGLKRIPVVALCQRVSVPVVVGIVKPMILLPPALLYGLDPNQVAAILSHELAHIRRYDLIVNLLQRIVEALLFFHPVTWWISRRVSLERENCCDDVAADGMGRLPYAGALLQMAELCIGNDRRRKAALATLSATGSNSTDLGYRIRRLIGAEETTRVGFTRRSISIGMALISLLAVSLVAWGQNQKTQDEDSADGAMQMIFTPAPLWQTNLAADDAASEMFRISPIVVAANRVLSLGKDFDLTTGIETQKPFVRLPRSYEFEVALAPVFRRRSSDHKYIVEASNRSPGITWTKPSFDLRVLRAKDGSQLGVTITVAGHFGSSDCDVDVENGGDFLVLGVGNEVQVYRTSTGQVETTLPVKTKRVDAVAISPDREWLVVSDQNDLHFWRWRDQAPVNTIHAGRKIDSLVFTPDGQYLAEGPDTREDIQIRDMRTLEVIASLKDEVGSPLMVSSMDITPDGRYLVAHNEVSVDPEKLTIPHRIHVWDLQSRGKPVFQIATGEWVRKVELSDDGRMIVGEFSGAAHGALLAAWKLPDELVNRKVDSPSDAKDRLGDGIQWSCFGDENGLRPGARLILPKDGLKARQPLVVEYRLANVSTDTKTLKCYLNNGMQFTSLGHGNRISGFLDRQREPVTLTIEPGDVFVDTEHLVSIDTTGLEPGKYQIALGSAFANTAHEIPHRGSIPFTIVGESTVKVTELPKSEIHWGKPIAGLQVGARFTGDAKAYSIGAMIEADLFVANVTDQPIECSVVLPHPGDGWPFNVEDNTGSSIMLERPTPIDGWRPQMYVHLKLAPGAIAPITGEGVQSSFSSASTNDAFATTLSKVRFQVIGTKEEAQQPWKNGSGIHGRLISQGGDYSAIFDVTLLRPEIPSLRLELDSGNVPFTVLNANENGLVVEEAALRTADRTAGALVAENLTNNQDTGALTGRISFDGVMPSLPKLRVPTPTSPLLSKRATEEERNKYEASLVEIDDESMQFNSEQGLANAFVYLANAPTNWQPTQEDLKPLTLTMKDYRFEPRAAIIRTGQDVRLNNSKVDAENLAIGPMKNEAQNRTVNAGTEITLEHPFTSPEVIPIQAKSQMNPWKTTFLLALDHPFAAITDSHGKFSIEGLPPGEHQFLIWHERTGWLEKSLVVNIEAGRTTEVNRSYSVERFRLSANQNPTNSNWITAPQICVGKAYSETAKATNWKWDQELRASLATPENGEMLASVLPGVGADFVVTVGLKFIDDAQCRLIVGETTFDVSQSTQLTKIKIGEKEHAFLNEDNANEWTLIQVQRRNNLLSVQVDEQSSINLGTITNAIPKISMQSARGTIVVKNFVVTGNVQKVNQTKGARNNAVRLLPDTIASSNDTLSSDEKSGSNKQSFKLVDGETGKPLQGLICRAFIAKRNAPPRYQEYSTDEHGVVEVVVAEDESAGIAEVPSGWFLNGFESVFGIEIPELELQSQQDAEKKNGEPKRLKLWRGTEVDGRLLWPDKTPAAGVKLKAGVYINNQSWKEKLGMDLTWYSFDHGDWPNWSRTIVTDEDGKFRVTVPPKDARFWLRIGTTQLGFGPQINVGENEAITQRLAKCVPLEIQYGASSRGNEQIVHDIAENDDMFLHAGDLQLETGVIVRGRVVDAEGKGLANVHLTSTGPHGPHSGRSATSGQDGKFEFPAMAPGNLTVHPDARLRDVTKPIHEQVISRDVQAVFVDQSFTIRAAIVPHQITIRAVPHTEVAFQWVDRRADKTQPIAFYGAFRVRGHMPDENGKPATYWTSETERVERDGKQWLMVKIPKQLLKPELMLVADSKVTGSYSDSTGVTSGPGIVELGDITANTTRTIFGDEPRKPADAQKEQNPKASSTSETKTRIEGIVLDSEKQSIAGVPLLFLAFEGDEVNAFKPIYLDADNEGRFSVEIPSRTFRVYFSSPNEQHENLGELFVRDGQAVAPSNGIETRPIEGKINVVATLPRAYQLQFDVINADSGQRVSDVAILYKEDKATWNGEDDYETGAHWIPYQIIENGKQTFQASTSRVVGNAHVLIAAKGFELVQLKLNDDLARGQPVVKQVRVKSVAPVEFTLTTASGEPAAGARLEVLKSKELQEIRNCDGVAQLHQFLKIDVKPDARGGVRFPCPAFSNWTTYRFEHPAGYVSVRGQDLPKAPEDKTGVARTIPLLAYTGVRGTYLPSIGENEFLEVYRLESNRNAVATEAQIVTVDQNGKFELTRLLHGWYSFVHRVRYADPKGVKHAFAIGGYGPFELSNEPIQEITLGNEGRSVVGRLKILGATDLGLDTLTISVSSNTRHRSPVEPQGLDEASLKTWWDAYWESEEGRQYHEASRRNYINATGADGRFHFPVLPAGKYKLRAGRAVGESNLLLRPEHEFEIPVATTSAPLDLGDVIVNVVNAASSEPIHVHPTETSHWTPARPLKVTVSSEGSAKILDDHSVRLEGDVKWQEASLQFAFDKPTNVEEIRLEILPVDSPAGPQFGRGGKELMLFDVKPGIEIQTGKFTSLDFASCTYLQNPSDETSPNCIDYLSDTGWKVPKLPADATAHALVFRLEKPITLRADQRMTLTVDSGGAKELAVLNRIRVAFRQRTDGEALKPSKSIESEDPTDDNVTTEQDNDS